MHLTTMIPANGLKFFSSFNSVFRMRESACEENEVVNKSIMSHMNYMH